MKIVAAALLTAALALPAGDPSGFYVWKSSDLKAYTKSLASKLDDKHNATEFLAKMEGYRFQITQRQVSGQGEWHEKQADIFVIQSGEATLIYGGDLVDGKTTAPGEMVAPAIRGGMEKKIAAGDIVTIPVKVPHQMKLDPGKQITYFVIKVG
jgi:mannose-6-phosphate isomerase-like protein (cupin superfamily)